MEKELLNSEKQLLLVDLCGRLPYDVKCKIEMWKGYDICTIFNINSIGYVEILEDSDTNGVNIENIKPYLFPLSSMTDEQLSKLRMEHDKDIKNMVICIKKCSEGDNSLQGKNISYHGVDWCNRNHYDYRGLIQKGLAIDATGLNIY